MEKESSESSGRPATEEKGFFQGVLGFLKGKASSSQDDLGSAAKKRPDEIKRAVQWRDRAQLLEIVHHYVNGVEKNRKTGSIEHKERERFEKFMDQIGVDGFMKASRMSFLWDKLALAYPKAECWGWLGEWASARDVDLKKSGLLSAFFMTGYQGYGLDPVCDQLVSAAVHLGIDLNDAEGLSEQVMKLDMPDFKGLSPLGIAFKAPNAKLFELCMANGADFNQAGISVQSMVFDCQQNLYPRMLGELAKAGARIDFNKNSKSANGTESLHASWLDFSDSIKNGPKDRRASVAEELALKCCKILLEMGADPNQKTYEGEVMTMRAPRSPLAGALRANAPNLAQFLINAGADIQEPELAEHLGDLEPRPPKEAARVVLNARREGAELKGKQADLASSLTPLESGFTPQMSLVSEQEDGLQSKTMSHLEPQPGAGASGSKSQEEDAAREALWELFQKGQIEIAEGADSGLLSRLEGQRLARGATELLGRASEPVKGAGAAI